MSDGHTLSEDSGAAFEGPNSALRCPKFLGNAWSPAPRKLVVLFDATLPVERWPPEYHSVADPALASCRGPCWEIHICLWCLGRGALAQTACFWSLCSARRGD